MTAALVTGPTNGQVQVYADGSFNYTPKAHWIGTDSFVYAAVDQLGASAQATATVTVTDDAPVANDDGIDPVGNVVWQVSWRKANPVEYTFTGNVLTNTWGTDSDTENDPLTPVLDSYPNGNIELTQGPTGAWNGEFTYWPTIGFSGYDSFTYHVNDGALDSNVATVIIRVQKVDLDLHDGGHPDVNGGYVPGDLVEDYKEETRGGYAVPNFNDTNGDGTMDSDQHPVTPGLDPHGYPEYDTMKLVINPPNPILSPNDTMEVEFSRGLDVWLTPTKMPFLDGGPTGDPYDGEYWEIPVSDLPKTVYVEVVRKSTEMRDMGITAYYNETQDYIPITGVYVLTGGMSAGQTQAQLSASFPDLDPSILSIFPRGTGVLPTTLDPPIPGTNNGIVFQWLVMPQRQPGDGTWEDDNIFFDVTRQFDGYDYYQFAPQTDWQLGETVRPAPGMVEEANDDTYDASASDHVIMPSGHLYSADLPSVLLQKFDAVMNATQVQYRINAREFVRIEIDAGSRQSGNGWKYSRGSDYVPWHSEMWCQTDPLQANWWNRRTDDVGNLHNDIGPGYIDNGYPL